MTTSGMCLYFQLFWGTEANKTRGLGYSIGCLHLAAAGVAPVGSH